MVGIIIALCYALWRFSFGSADFPEIFLAASNFLFWWYLITSGIFAVICALIAVAIISGATIVGALAGGKKWSILTGLLGFSGAGAISLLFLAAALINRVFLISGAYLLYCALILQPGGNYEWNYAKLIFGCFTLAIGITIKSILFSANGGKNG